MKIGDAFPSNYLKASDLGDSQPVVKIASVKPEAIGRDKELKPVVYFEGKTKGLVLNKTNAKKITEIAGSDDTDDWTGVAVRLYATETEFSGETVECIRIKGPSTVKAKPKPVNDDEGLGGEEIPFAFLLPFVLPLTGLVSLMVA